MITKWQIIKERDGTYTLMREGGTLQKREWLNVGGPHASLVALISHLGEPKPGESYEIEFINDSKD